MSRLIPEKRVDKNGRVVTKHVKADTGASEARKSLPAPITSKSDRPVTKDDYAREIAEFLLEAAGIDDINLGRSMYGTALGGRTLKLIHERMNDWGERDSDNFEESMSILINETLKSKDTQSYRDRLAITLVEAMPVISMFGEEQPVPWNTASSVKDIDHYAALNKVRVVGAADIPENDRAAFRFLAFESIIGVPPTYRTRAALDADAKWFDENAGKLMPYKEELKKRRTSDLGLLRALISEDGHSALSGGTL